MYSTKGIETIASITELRANTADIVDYANASSKGILIQKNNEPYAVLLSYEYYLQLINSQRSKRGRKRKNQP